MTMCLLLNAFLKLDIRHICHHTSHFRTFLGEEESIKGQTQATQDFSVELNVVILLIRRSQGGRLGL